MSNTRTAALTCFAYANSLAVMMWIIATELDLTANQRLLMLLGGWAVGLIVSIFYVSQRTAPQC